MKLNKLEKKFIREVLEQGCRQAPLPESAQDAVWYLTPLVIGLIEDWDTVKPTPTKNEDHDETQ